MVENRSSISKAKSYLEMGEFWDNHEITDYWELTKPVEFEVDIRSETTYYAVEPTLSNRLERLAEKRGISAETLLNLWLQEKINDSLTPA